MSMILPLVIVLFIYGVYCPGISGPREQEEQVQGFLSNYELESCITHSQNLEIHSSATMRFQWNRETPSACKLMVRWRGEVNYYPFQRADVEFTSLLEEEVTLTVHGSPRTEWSMTCYFFVDATCQHFHKLITHDRHSELVLLATMDYLKSSVDFLLAERPNLNIYYEGEGNVTIAVYDGDYGVLLFKRDSVFEISQPEPTKIELFIKSTNRDGRKLYKMGFPNPAQAAALIELLGERPQLNGVLHDANEAADGD